MSRRLSTMGAALSLLLALAVVAIWIRGYIAFDRVIVGVGTRCVLIEIRKGGLALIVARRDPSAVSEWLKRSPQADKERTVPHDALGGGPLFQCQTWGTRYLVEMLDGAEPWGVIPGITYAQIVFPGGGNPLMRELTISHWLTLTLLLLWPARLAQQWSSDQKRARRKARRLCTACGYDLRGSTTSIDCPECGEPIPAPPSHPPA